MKVLSIAAVALIASVISSALAADAPSQRKTESGLTIIEVKTLGDAMKVEKDDIVWVHYTGKLENGTVFDSSFKRLDEKGDATPIKFRLGRGDVIGGLEEGVAGMKVGEKRQLIIPPALAYKAEGAGEVIPPNATLTFDVELVGIYRPQK